NNIAHDLVTDLHVAKEKAVTLRKRVTLKAVQPKPMVFGTVSGNTPFRYVIIYDMEVAQEVVLPEGITLSGIVVFLEDGMPEKPSSFILSQGKRTATVEIDRKGLVSVP
ncbi:MAG TPA: GspH/FimT family protein, partial [Candidatus Melainabacteria bacterium]|nr:GspH/FimT family protein [Candidatus Melainabacteria bacterium]